MHCTMKKLDSDVIDLLIFSFLKPKSKLQITCIYNVLVQLADMAEGGAAAFADEILVSKAIITRMQQIYIYIYMDTGIGLKN